MLRFGLELGNYVLDAKDGEIGRCKDFLFDDRHWGIRYMMANTGKWLPGREVLISPVSLGIPDHDAKRFPVKLTKEEIRKCPPLEQDAPVSRKYETLFHGYYGLPLYWSGDHLWGFEHHPAKVALPAKLKEKREEMLEEAEKGHLRSIREVNGYKTFAAGEKIGYIDDFAIDVDYWAIRYVLVDSRKWLPGRKFVVPAMLVENVQWTSGEIEIAVEKEALRNSPWYDPASHIDRGYEEDIFRYYGQAPYFEE